MYNSTNYLNITQSDSKISFKEQELKDVSNGMQFPPLMESQNQLRIFDPRNIKVATYLHDSTKYLGNLLKLELEKYVGTSFGDDISFGFNLPLYEKAFGCYGCNLNADEQRKVIINGTAWEQSDVESDNYMIVQPDAGYTYEMVKNSSVYMIVGGN